MGDIKAWIEEHPYLSGSAVLGLIILYLLFSSSSSSTTAATSSGVAGTGLSSSDYASLQEAQIAAGAQAQQTQDAATVQNNTLSAQLAAVQLQSQATTTANQLAANVQLQNIVTAGQVSENTNATQLATAQVQTGGQVQLAGISAGEDESIAGTNAQTLEDQYSAAVASEGIVSQAQTAQAQANAQTQQQIAGYAASVQLAGIGAEVNQTNVTGSVDLAGIAAQAGVQNNQITTAGNEYYDNLQAEESEYGGYLATVQNNLAAGTNLISSGALNKGGTGGAAQAGAFTTLFGTGVQAP